MDNFEVTDLPKQVKDIAGILSMPILGKKRIQCLQKMTVGMNPPDHIAKNN